MGYTTLLGKVSQWDGGSKYRLLYSGISINGNIVFFPESSYSRFSQVLTGDTLGIAGVENQ